MTKRVLAIIPARGGSKGLPRKNIISLAGKPLIAWTIEASLRSKYITKTIVSSDDDEIKSVSFDYGAEVIDRPVNLATDEASSESVIKHAVDYLKCNGEEFDIIILLQPTSPLRTTEHIDNAFKMMFDSQAESVISVCDFDNKVLKTFLNDHNGYLTGIVNDEYPFMRRQDLPKVYMPNGAIYIIWTSSFFKNRSLLTVKTLGFIMAKGVSADVDSWSDLDEIEKYSAR